MNHAKVEVCHSVREVHYLPTSCQQEPWQHGRCQQEPWQHIAVSLCQGRTYSSTSCEQEPWQQGALSLRERGTSTYHELSTGTVTTGSFVTAWERYIYLPRAVNRNHDNMELSTGTSMTKWSLIAVWVTYIHSSTSLQQESWQHGARLLCEGHTPTHHELLTGTMTIWSCQQELWQHGVVPLYKGHVFINKLSLGTMTTWSVAVWGTYIYSSTSCQREPWQKGAVSLCEGRTFTY